MPWHNVASHPLLCWKTGTGRNLCLEEAQGVTTSCVITCCEEGGALLGTVRGGAEQVGRGWSPGRSIPGSRLRRSGLAAGGSACVRSLRRSVPDACPGEAQAGATRRTDWWTDSGVAARLGSEQRGGTSREPGNPRALRLLLTLGTGRGRQSCGFLLSG